MKNSIYLFYTWAAPFLILLSCLYFFSIFGWLTKIEQQPNRWFEEGEALFIWSVPALFLCTTGFIFSCRVKSKILIAIYSCLFFLSFSLIVLMAALSNVGAAKT